jgi:hypothetical protein
VDGRSIYAQMQLMPRTMPTMISPPLEDIGKTMPRFLKPQEATPGNQ